MNVTIVTPWCNHMELAKDYWTAVAATGAAVLVVDNGSVPPLPNGIRLERNEGFSPASNVGFGMVRTEAVCFLNNDVYATSSDWLEKLMSALLPGVLVGPQLRTDPHAQVDGIPMPYLDGWCLLGMTEDIFDIGGWDESYEEPSYYGDNDLCLRARAYGMMLREVPRTGIHHKGGVTSNANGYLLPSTIANRARFESLARDLLGVAA